MPVYGIYRMILEVVGHDQTGNIFQRMTAGLGSILQYATAIVGAMVFEKIASGIASMVSSTVEAVAYMQQMDLALTQFAARELVMTGQAASIEAAWGAASVKGGILLDMLQELAILSPYTVESVTQTYRMAVAFGYTTDEAVTFTEALLNNAAGIGADNSMLDRMAYNLAQVRLQGKVTALDIRQLALAGFDLMSVLKYVGKEMGVEIETHLDFNEAIKSGKITWEDFTKGFAKYADENFGGASERMARTLIGLKSTFHDVFVLTMPKIFGPAAESITVFLNEILNKFIAFRDTGKLEAMAGGIKAWVDKVLGALRLFMVPGFDPTKNWINLINQMFPEADAEGIVSTVTNAWKVITGIWDWGVSIVTEVVGNLKEIFAGLSAFWEQNGAGIIDAMSKIFGGIAKESTGVDPSWIDIIFTPLKGFTDWLITNGPQITTTLGAVAAFFVDTLLPAIRKALTFLADNWQSIVLFFAAFKIGSKIFSTIATVVKIVGVVIAALSSPITLIVGAIALLAVAWTQNWFGIQEAVGKVWAWLQPILQTYIPMAVQWASTVWTTVLLPAITAVWTWISTVFLPFITGVLIPWLQVNIPAAIQFLSNIWTTILLPALTSVYNYVTEYVIPFLETLANVVGTVVGTAVSILSALWTNILLPAITAIWEFISTYLMPIWTAIADMVGNIVTTAIQLLSDFWTNTLGPAMQGVWDLINTSILPIIQDIVDIFTLITDIVGAAFAGFWENILQPKLAAVYKEINEFLLPIFTDVNDFINDHIGPTITWLSEEVFGPLVAQMEGGLKNALEWFHGILVKIKDFLSTFVMPDWLSTHSPTPLEMGLRGINSELDLMASRRLPRVGAMLGKLPSVNPAMPFGSSMVGSGNGGLTVTVNVDNVGSDVDVDRMAYVIAQTIQRKRSYG